MDILTIYVPTLFTCFMLSSSQIDFVLHLVTIVAKNGSVKTVCIGLRLRLILTLFKLSSNRSSVCLEYPVKLLSFEFKMTEIICFSMKC